MVTEYISREDLIERLKKAKKTIPEVNPMMMNGCLCGLERAIMETISIPAADVAEVVRCKNCKNADFTGMGCCWVWCNEMQQGVSEDGWCYRGEDMRGET